MKKYLTTIIALIVIAVALTGFFVAKKAGWLEPAPSPTEEPDDTVTGPIFAFLREDGASARVMRIESVFDGTRLSLVRSGGGWTSDSNPELAVISRNVDFKLNSMSNLNGREAYCGEVTESKQLEFGLADSNYYVEFTDDDGTEHRVVFGKENQNGYSCYAWEEGRDVIYLVGKSSRDSSLIKAGDLITSRIFYFDDNGQINSISISRDGQPYVRMNAILSTAPDEPRSWQVTYPLERAGDSSPIEAFLTNLNSLMLAEVQELGAEDLAQYGVSPAKYKVVVSDPGKSIALALGDTTPDRAYYYAAINNTNDVYLISASSVDFTDEPELTYIDEYVFMVRYTLLSRVDLEVLGDKFVLRYDALDDDAEEVFTFNGVNTYIDEDHDYRGDFKRIGTAMYGLRMSGLEAEPAEKGELLCRIRYEQHDGTVTTVECYARNETTMYYYLNGSYVGGYGKQYLLNSDNENYGITGTVANLCEKLGIPYTQAE
ncbi:MAG: DUF4340 domain-containing protein [Clostridia bacterium]|nr:DUF4340 domain-containing protein [Clostridia bacterium]